MRRLRAFLAVRGVHASACVEKSELVALAQQAVAADGAGGAGPSAAAAGSASGGLGGPGGAPPITPAEIAHQASALARNWVAAAGATLAARADAEQLAGAYSAAVELLQSQGSNIFHCDPNAVHLLMVSSTAEPDRVPHQLRGAVCSLFGSWAQPGQAPSPPLHSPLHALRPPLQLLAGRNPSRPDWMRLRQGMRLWESAHLRTLILTLLRSGQRPERHGVVAPGAWRVHAPSLSPSNPQPL